MPLCSGQGVFDYRGEQHVENFDSFQLGTSPGWYAYRSELGTLYYGRADLNWVLIDAGEIRSSSGQRIDSGTGVLLNLGNSGDRALGAIPLSTDLAFALVMRNDAGDTLGCFRLSGFAEQWQINTVAGPGSMLAFSYGAFPSFVDKPRNPNTILPQTNNPDQFYDGYTRVPEMSFGAWRFRAGVKRRRAVRVHAPIADESVVRWGGCGRRAGPG